MYLTGAQESFDAEVGRAVNNQDKYDANRTQETHDSIPHE